MGARRCPKALPWQGVLLLGLCLLPCPGCHAEVQVSVPAVVDVLLGQRVSISCTHTVTGDTGYHLVEWFITDKNGEQHRVAYSERGQQGADKNTEYTDRVSMDPDYSLVIEAADLSDERAFTCRVMATAGNGGGTAQVKVYDPPESPEVRWNTRTLSVTGGQVSEIAACTSRNANPVPTISWYKDGRLLPAPPERNNNLYVVSRTVKEASGLHSVSSTLYLHLNKTDKDSVFHCQVTYYMPHGEVHSLESESFKLTLHYYTENVEFRLDSPKVIKEGDEVQLICQGDGNPPPEYLFFKVQDQSQNQFQDLGAKPNGLLVLPQVTKEDSGTYRCQVLDFDSPPEVELEKEVTIQVHYLDMLVLNPNKMVKVPLGGNTELTCSGNGSQTPTLSWRKGKEHVENGRILALTSLTYHMAGTYTCEASVPSVPGLHRDQSVQVVVEGKPQLEQHQSPSQYHSFGQKVMLTCSVLGYPEPLVSWSVPGETSMNSSANRVTSRLSVEVTPELAESGVKCLAKNQHGSAEQMFQLETAAPTVPATAVPVDQEGQGGSTVAVIAVCVCVLLLLLIVGFFYFMQRRGRLPCGGGEKRSLTPKEGNPDDTVVEMKTDKRNEQTGLLSPGGGGGGGTNEC